MDPKSLSSIDPKLRETYERVMGTATGAPSTPPPSVPGIPPAIPNDMPLPTSSPAPAFTAGPVQAAPPSQPSFGLPPSISAPSFPAAQPAQPMANTPPIEIQQQQQPIKYPQPLTAPAAAGHSASPIVKVLYIIGGVVFFAIYTIFWIKVFKIPFFF